MDPFDLIGAQPLVPFLGTDSVDIAIASGNRDLDSLTDIEFQRRHPERGGTKIQRGEVAAAREWTDIRDNVVRPALARASSSTALTKMESATPAPAAEPDSGWTFGRTIKYSLGGLALLLLGWWAVKHRGTLGLEARTATRHAGQLAGRAKASLKAIGSEHRALRQNVAQERQAAQREERERALQAELVAADRRVQEATRKAEEKARALQGLRSLRAGA